MTSKRDDASDHRPAAVVAIAQDDRAIGRAVEDALDRLSLAHLVRDKIVAVKPNDTWCSLEDRTGVTQPDTLRAVLEHLQRFAPRELVVTGGAGAAETEDVFRIAGLMDVVRETGATFFDHNRPPFVEVALEYAPGRDVSGPQRSVVVNPRVLEYETLISLNQLKLHATATVTLALKNVAMSFPAADHYGHPREKQKHRHTFFDDMHSFIAAMAKRFPIHLAITAGHPAMIATGPLGGKAVETGIVIASEDPLAADTVGARLLGFDPQAVRHLWEAARLGLGETDTSRMKFVGLELAEATRRFTRAAYGTELDFTDT
jgi:uncharacterized protein (DUF362 family)